ncbi:hypothetical protein K450DRAFT_201932 [Umbelopsis ramanniana AG]|uniref:BHLH domain-containing protein n=1 Tax=Umbelopsis ramanniana AG TaxID=1314678 RepID=A0AAD5E2Y7_UMBRA|nr:uncharacterized protein K450DRAFT_201932 [Umbelopsis ramanniana AG]KAI8576598.1 hypothetical protein K450DRAFT_201932 [Umbelopsis ramanniana AG]
MSIASSHNSPIIDHRDRVADVMDDPFNTDADMVYFTTSADKEVMSPVLESMDTPRHGGHDLGKMVEAYERQFHLNHTHHSMSLSLTPAITSFDLIDQNEKWHEISSRTRESTPLLSPAITPSMTYRHQTMHSTPHEDFTSSANDVFSSDEMELTPLSSPAIIPQESSELHSENVDNLDAVQRHLENLEQTKNMLKKQLAELQQQGRGVVNQSNLMNTLSQRTDMQHAIRNAGPTRASNRSRITYSPYKSASQPRKTNTDHHTIPSDPSSISMPPPLTTLKGSWSMVEDNSINPGASNTKSPIDLKPATPSSVMNIKTKSKANQPRRSSVSSYKSTPKLIPSVTPRPSPAKPSPRALRPLLVSPTLDVYSSIEDAAKALEAKSNYQNLREGKTDVLGIKFSPGINAGLENRRSAHKKAEKRRRDSLKDWFNKLRDEIVTDMDEDINSSDDEGSVSKDGSQEKAISKLAVLSKTCDYMKRLKEELKKRDDHIASLEEKLKLSNTRVTLG